MVKFQLMERPFQMIFQRVQTFEEADGCGRISPVSHPKDARPD